MTIAAFIVPTILGAISTIIAISAKRDSRRSADAAQKTAQLDLQRRHADLRPKFTFKTQAYSNDRAELTVLLEAPEALGQLDRVIGSIRDDHPWHGDQAESRSSTLSRQQIDTQIWGPYRFVPGTGPGADPGRGIPGADETGRTTPLGAWPVGERMIFALEHTTPPPWAQGMTRQQWRSQYGNVLRLRFTCYRDGWEPWIIPIEVPVNGVVKVINPADYPRFSRRPNSSADRRTP